MTHYSDPFRHWGLRKTINVSGTMTSIGASRVRDEVIEAVTAVLPRFVDINELQSRASSIIAKSTGAQAGCVTDCSAAGVCQSVAAAITGSNLAAIEQLPDCGPREHRVAIQMGHMINYGGPIHQMITVTGAALVTVGTAAMCEAYHLREALEQGCAAAVYVVSHHTVREGELPLPLFIEICQEFNTPAIIDMASEYDLRTPIELGASAVVYSGHKFLSGTTSGIVAGSIDMIRAVYLQSRGIGRLMKVGKESIVGAMAALELWETRDAEKIRDRENDIVQLWMSQLSAFTGVAISTHDDWTGNPITRLKLVVDGKAAGLFAWELSDRLSQREPAIIVRSDLVEHGEIYLDPCNATMEEARMAGDAIIDVMAAACRAGDGCVQSWADAKRQRSISPLEWPMHA